MRFVFSLLWASSLVVQLIAGEEALDEEDVSINTIGDGGEESWDDGEFGEAFTANTAPLGPEMGGPDASRMGYFQPEPYPIQGPRPRVAPQSWPPTYSYYPNAFPYGGDPSGFRVGDPMQAPPRAMMTSMPMIIGEDPFQPNGMDGVDNLPINDRYFPNLPNGQPGFFPQPEMGPRPMSSSPTWPQTNTFYPVYPNGNNNNNRFGTVDPAASIVPNQMKTVEAAELGPLVGGLEVINPSDDFPVSNGEVVKPQTWLPNGYSTGPRPAPGMGFMEDPSYNDGRPIGWANMYPITRPAWPLPRPVGFNFSSSSSPMPMSRSLIPPGGFPMTKPSWPLAAPVGGYPGAPPTYLPPGTYPFPITRPAWPLPKPVYRPEPGGVFLPPLGTNRPIVNGVPVEKPTETNIPEVKEDKPGQAAEPLKKVIMVPEVLPQLRSGAPSELSVRSKPLTMMAENEFNSGRMGGVGPWTMGSASGWTKSFTPVPGYQGCFNRCRPRCMAQPTMQRPPYMTYGGSDPSSSFGMAGFEGTSSTIPMMDPAVNNGEPPRMCRPSCSVGCNVRPQCSVQSTWAGNTLVCNNNRPFMPYPSFDPPKPPAVYVPPEVLPTPPQVDVPVVPRPTGPTADEGSGKAPEPV